MLLKMLRFLRRYFKKIWFYKNCISRQIADSLGVQFLIFLFNPNLQLVTYIMTEFPKEWSRLCNIKWPLCKPFNCWSCVVNFTFNKVVHCWSFAVNFTFNKVIYYWSFVVNFTFNNVVNFTYSPLASSPVILSRFFTYKLRKREIF
jgi:hypothetical protein